jgi:hypothetical protein
MEAVGAAQYNVSRRTASPINSKKLPYKLKTMDVTTSLPSPSSSQSMAEIARAKLQEARAKARLDEERKHKSENDKAHKWREFSDTFYTCGPTKLALAAGVTSTASKQQTTYIVANERLLRAAAERNRVVEAVGDPLLLRVAALQSEDGRWEPSSALTEALGGAVPEPPEGIVDWRWSTACAMAFLRRRPDQFEFFKEAHDKGLPWLKPSWLKAAAKTMLPPFPHYFDVDQTSAQQGRWRDSENLVFERKGLKGFREPIPKPPTPPPARPSSVHISGDDQPRAVTTRQGGTRSAAPVIDEKRFTAHQKLLRDEFAVLTKASKGSRGRNVEQLVNVWAEPCAMKAERDRLELSRRLPNAGIPWDSSGVGRSRDGDRGPRPSRARTRTTPTKAPVQQTTEDASEQEEEEEEESSDDDDENDPAGGLLGDGASYDVAARELEASRLNVVACCALYDAYREEIEAAAKEGALVWQASRMNHERIVAFAKLTEMLGPYMKARKGFADWRGRPVKGMQSITLALVEAVGRWRAAILGNHAAMESNDPPPFAGARLPFMWNGQNILLTVCSGLDFLGHSYPEIGEWYGSEYDFKRNPFCRASPLDERPSTPPSAKMTILVDGELVEKVNPRLLAAKEAAEAVMASHQTKARNAPKWWPAQGGQRHKDRIRAAEKVLLEEEAAFGQLRLPPRTANVSRGASRAASRGR